MPIYLKNFIFLTLLLFLTGEAFSRALASPDAKAVKKGAIWLPPANETLTYDIYYFGHRYYDPITGQWLSREMNPRANQ